MSANYEGPAEDWVDEIAVERAAAGKTVGRKLTEAERRAVARTLIRRGETVNIVATRLHSRFSVAQALVDQVKKELQRT